MTCDLCGGKIYKFRLFNGGISREHMLMSQGQPFAKIRRDICFPTIPWASCGGYSCMNKCCPRSPLFYENVMNGYSVLDFPYESIPWGLGVGDGG